MFGDISGCRYTWASRCGFGIIGSRSFRKLRSVVLNDEGGEGLLCIVINMSIG